MKKLLMLIFSSLFVVCAALGLPACGGDSNNQGGSNEIQTPLPEYPTPETPMHTHTLSLVSAKTADCVNSGNSAYYTCTCGKWFTDSNAKTEITDKASVVINALGHKYSTEWSQSNTQHWHSANCEHDLIKDEQYHNFNSQYICPVCDYSQLVYKLNDDGTAYSIKDCNVCPVNVIIPSSYKGLPITGIGKSAFYNWWNLTSVTIPNSVTSIGDYAFHYCKNLTTVIISNSVASIGIQAFWDCENLSEISIGNNVVFIGDGAFYGCKKLSEIVIPKSVTNIATHAFAHCDGLTSINIPDSVIRLGEQAFANCGELTTVTIGNGVSQMEDYVFESCSKLNSVTIKSGIKNFNWQAFAYCDNLTSVNFEGTMEQWNLINKSGVWYYDSNSIKSIICSDGTMELVLNTL